MAIDQSNLPFDDLYRPKTLSRIIGHEKAIIRLQGIIKSKRWPAAVLFVGSTSSGKTTLGRAFAADILGVETPVGHRDYYEQNAAVTRGIDETRDLQKIASLRPWSGIRRLLFIDEAQQLTPQAAQSMLKSLEKPPPQTMWILGSMEPEKLLQAIKNRCSVFILAKPSKENIIRFLKRIVKAEEMTYVPEELLSLIAENSNGEMRTAAHVLQSIHQYAYGLEKFPKVLSKEHSDAALTSGQTNDDVLALRVMAGLYARKYRVIQLALLDVQDSFRFILTLLRLNSFMLNDFMLRGEKHKLVWFSKQHIDLKNAMDKIMIKTEAGTEALIFGTVQTALVDLKFRSSSFLVPEINLISSVMFETVQKLKKLCNEVKSG